MGRFDAVPVGRDGWSWQMGNFNFESTSRRYRINMCLNKKSDVPHWSPLVFVDPWTWRQLILRRNHRHFVGHVGEQATGEPRRWAIVFELRVRKEFRMQLRWNGVVPHGETLSFAQLSTIKLGVFGVCGWRPPSTFIAWAPLLELDGEREQMFLVFVYCEWHDFGSRLTATAIIVNQYCLSLWTWKTNVRGRTVVLRFCVRATQVA